MNNFEPKPFYINKTNSTNNLHIMPPPSQKVGLENKSISQIAFEIEKKANAILEQLNIDPSLTNPIFRDFNIFKLFKYIVETPVYDISILEEKQKDIKDGNTFDELVIKDIYRCLCENRCVCSSDTCALSYLLSKMGVDSSPVIILDKDENRSTQHQILALELSNKLYFLDPTLIRTLFSKGTMSKLTLNNFAFTKQEYFEKIRHNVYHISSLLKPVDIKKYINPESQK